mmetsp:Transcript_449/g.1755  ORF Transcript_449/g.1755 Transcript_449/m.1755 type:complete len:232 (+) Transcript_449:428-1123(+)
MRVNTSDWLAAIDRICSRTNSSAAVCASNRVSIASSAFDVCRTCCWSCCCFTFPPCVCVGGAKTINPSSYASSSSKTERSSGPTSGTGGGNGVVAARFWAGRTATAFPNPPSRSIDDAIRIHSGASSSSDVTCVSTGGGFSAFAFVSFFDSRAGVTGKAVDGKGFIPSPSSVPKFPSPTSSTSRGSSSPSDDATSYVFPSLPIPRGVCTGSRAASSATLVVSEGASACFVT